MSVSIFHVPPIFVEVKIPVIVVFTKFDILVVEHFRACGHIESRPDRKVEATNRALRVFNERAKELQVKFKVPFVPVSTKRDGGLLIISIISLFLQINCYCRGDARGIDQGDAGESAGCRRFIVGPLGHCSTNWCASKGRTLNQVRFLHDKWCIELWLKSHMLAKASRASLIISLLSNFITPLTDIAEYWRNLGESVVFQGHRLIDCIARIHDDILKIWNFYDPLKVSMHWHPWKRTLTFIFQVLSGEEFLKRMTGLVEPLAAVSIPNQRWVAFQVRTDLT